jgi:hypothetical protein
MQFFDLFPRNDEAFRVLIGGRGVWGKTILLFAKPFGEGSIRKSTPSYTMNLNDLTVAICQTITHPERENDCLRINTPILPGKE